MSRATKPANVRFYFDADVLGLAKAVTALRSDATYPGDSGGVVHRRKRPACPVTSPATPDSEWIAEIARRGWLIITRDRRIRDHQREIVAVREHGAKMVTLAGEDARGTWNQLEVLLCQRRAIEGQLAGQAGPFIYRATRTALTRHSLE